MMKHATKQPSIALAFALTIGLLINSGCKKDRTTQINPGNKTYTVTYNINAFNQQFSNTPLTAAAKRNIRAAATNDSLKSLIDLLYCAVYDSNGKFVSMVQQDSSQADFGHVSTTLTAGTYQVVFFGGKNGIYYNQVGGIGDDYVFYTGANGGTNWIVDSFYDKDTVTVGPGSTTENVTMGRIVGKVMVTLQDQLPAAVDSLVLQNLDECNSFAVGAGQGQGRLTTTMSFKVPAASRGKANYAMTFLTLSRSFKLYIYAYGGGTSYAFDQVWNIPSAANSTTEVTGGLFGGGSNYSGGFHVVVDPTWNPTPISQSF